MVLAKLYTLRVAAQGNAATAHHGVPGLLGGAGRLSSITSFGVSRRAWSGTRSTPTKSVEANEELRKTRGWWQIDQKSLSFSCAPNGSQRWWQMESTPEAKARNKRAASSSSSAGLRMTGIPRRIALPSGSEVFRSKIKFGDSFDCVCRLYSSLTGTKNDQISKRSSTRNGFCFVCPTGSKSKQQAAWSTYRCYLSLQLRTKAAAAAISWMAILQTMAQPRHWLG